MRFSNGELGESWINKMQLYWRVSSDYPNISLDLIAVFKRSFLIPYKVFRMLLDNVGNTVGYDTLIQSIPCTEEDILVLLVLAHNEGIPDLFLDRQARVIGYKL